MDVEEGKFYRGKYEEQISKQLETMNKKLDDQAKQLVALDKKISYVYAWATGVAFAFSFVFMLVKDWIRTAIAKVF